MKRWGARGNARGYTAVELLMSVAILTIGVTGVVAMQKVTITSNQHAKNLAVATQIGQAWMDQLRADALGWNHPSAQIGTSDLATDTVWLQAAEGAQITDWHRPAWNEGRAFGAAFDAQGRAVNPTTSAGAIRYCTHLRLSWLSGAGGMAGNGLIRAEVRVFWLREGQSGIDNRAVCDNSESAPAIGDRPDLYHFVYNVSAIRQNNLF